MKSRIGMRISKGRRELRGSLCYFHVNSLLRHALGTLLAGYFAAWESLRCVAV
jgi:hypothetical protein